MEMFSDIAGESAEQPFVNGIPTSLAMNCCLGRLKIFSSSAGDIADPSLVTCWGIHRVIP